MTTTNPSDANNGVRYKNHREQFLAALSNGDWVDCSTFTRISRNHTARIAELRNKGYNIEIEILDQGETRYRLTGIGEPVTSKPRRYSPETILRWVESADLDELRLVRDAVNSKLRTIHPSP